MPIDTDSAEPLADSALDELLGRELTLVDRAADMAFVAKVDCAIAERQLYRRRRADLWRQLSGEMLSIAALGGSLTLIARIPAVREALVQMPMVAWPALLSLLLFWIVVTRPAPRALA